jgi:hypothetical protein
MQKKTMTTADLASHLEGYLGLTATAAETAVTLLFRVCETALAHSGTGESVGIGFGRLHAVPGRLNELGAWRPAFQPSRTFLRYLDRLQARACAGERLGMAFPRMHCKDLVDLLVNRGMRRAMAARVAKATVAYWFDRLISSSVPVAGPSGGKLPIVRSSAGLPIGALPALGRRGTGTPANSVL